MKESYWESMKNKCYNITEQSKKRKRKGEPSHGPDEVSKGTGSALSKCRSCFNRDHQSSGNLASSQRNRALCF